MSTDNATKMRTTILLAIVAGALSASAQLDGPGGLSDPTPICGRFGLQSSYPDDLDSYTNFLCEASAGQNVAVGGAGLQKFALIENQPGGNFMMLLAIKAKSVAFTVD